MAQPRRYDSASQRQAAYRDRAAQARTQQLQALRLPPLPAPSHIPGQVRWCSLLRHAHWALGTVAREMNDYCEARTDTWQESERGEDFQERLDTVQEMLEAIEQFGSDHSIRFDSLT